MRRLLKQSLHVTRYSGNRLYFSDAPNILVEFS
jgi:hypothetical protein